MRMYLLLKSLPNFDSFLTYFQIPEETIRHALLFMEVFQFKHNQIIFNQGDQSDYFYLIIKGSVAIRENFPTKKGLQLQDKVILKEGCFFGEFGLINNQPRAQSAVCVCNGGDNYCILFGINIEHFRTFFYSYISKAESARKCKLIELIPMFKKMPFQKFNHLYKDFVFYKIPTQQYIYKEGDIADSLFFIINGRCRLTKQKYNLVYVGRNDLVGLEAIDYNIKSDINQQPKYKQTLTTIDDTFVIKIRMQILGGMVYSLKESLIEMRNMKEKLITNLLTNNIKEKSKFKLIYHEKDIKNRINNPDPVNINKLSKTLNQIKEENKNRKPKSKHAYENVVNATTTLTKIPKHSGKSLPKEALTIQRNSLFSLEHQHIRKKLFLSPNKQREFHNPLSLTNKENLLIRASVTPNFRSKKTAKINQLTDLGATNNDYYMMTYMFSPKRKKTKEMSIKSNEDDSSPRVSTGTNTEVGEGLKEKVSFDYFTNDVLKSVFDWKKHNKNKTLLTNSTNTNYTNENYNNINISHSVYNAKKTIHKKTISARYDTGHFSLPLMINLTEYN